MTTSRQNLHANKGFYERVHRTITFGSGTHVPVRIRRNWSGTLAEAGLILWPGVPALLALTLLALPLEVNGFRVLCCSAQ